MIECTVENIYYKKKRKPKFKKIFKFIIAIIVLLLLFLYYKNCICVQIKNVCVDYVYAKSVDCVNVVALDSLSNKIKYSDLISIEKDNTGQIILMSVNSVKTNTIGREVCILSQEKIDKTLEKGVPIPWTSFLGSSLFSGYGSKVYLKIASISSVECEFSSTFQSVGINQTLHSIYIDLIIKAVIEMPFSRQVQSFNTSIMISESVLVGRVPEIYLKNPLFS